MAQKSCVRFKKLENLPLDVIGEIVGCQSVDEFVAQYEAARAGAAGGGGRTRKKK